MQEKLGLRFTFSTRRDLEGQYRFSLECRACQRPKARQEDIYFVRVERVHNSRFPAPSKVSVWAQWNSDLIPMEELDGQQWQVNPAKGFCRPLYCCERLIGCYYPLLKQNHNTTKPNGIERNYCKFYQLSRTDEVLLVARGDPPPSEFNCDDLDVQPEAIEEGHQRLKNEGLPARAKEHEKALIIALRRQLEVCKSLPFDRNNPWETLEEMQRYLKAALDCQAFPSLKAADLANWIFSSFLEATKTVANEHWAKGKSAGQTVERVTQHLRWTVEILRDQEIIPDRYVVDEARWHFENCPQNPAERMQDARALFEAGPSLPEGSSFDCLTEPRAVLASGDVTVGNLITLFPGPQQRVTLDEWVAALDNSDASRSSTSLWAAILPKLGGVKIPAVLSTRFFELARKSQPNHARPSDSILLQLLLTCEADGKIDFNWLALVDLKNASDALFDLPDGKLLVGNLSTLVAWAFRSSLSHREVFQLYMEHIHKVWFEAHPDLGRNFTHSRTLDIHSWGGKAKFLPEMFVCVTAAFLHQHRGENCKLAFGLGQSGRKRGTSTFSMVERFFADQRCAFERGTVRWQIPDKVKPEDLLACARQSLKRGVQGKR